MSTKTVSTNEPTEGSSPSPSHSGTQATLLLLVFIAGAVSLSIEMAASRLFAPYFGTDLFVWANIIGLILLYLAVGYSVGGRLADRYPQPRVLSALTATAALLTCLIPLIGHPLLAWLQDVTAGLPLAEFYGSLIALLLLFTLPMLLLGCVSPFAIRLHTQQIGSAGRTAGLLYAISTAGSILGTFLPVLVLMPWIGTNNTFLLSGIVLLLFSLPGIFLRA